MSKQQVVTDASRMVTLLEQQLLSIGRLLEYYTNGTISGSVNQLNEIVQLQTISAKLSLLVAGVSGLPYGADAFTAGTPDVNGNNTVYVYTKSSVTVKTVTMTFDASDNVTSYVES
jgi:sulfite exporter TauE/SafE